MKLKEAISFSSYPGRGIITGLINKNIVCNIYFIMGRSSNSRNRIFVLDNENVKILPFNEKLVEDPSLIIYYPFRKYNEYLICTNGNQTDVIYDGLKKGISPIDSLNTCYFEPDFPNFTPRISSVTNLNKRQFIISEISSKDDLGKEVERNYFTYKLENNKGRFIHTYFENTSPLPSFKGEPKEVELEDLDINSLLKEVYDNLNKENKISVFVSFYNLDTNKLEIVIKNKNEVEK